MRYLPRHNQRRRSEHLIKLLPQYLRAAIHPIAGSVYGMTKFFARGADVIVDVISLSFLDLISALGSALTNQSCEHSSTPTVSLTKD